MENQDDDDDIVDKLHCKNPECKSKELKPNTIVRHLCHKNSKKCKSFYTEEEINDLRKNSKALTNKKHAQNKRKKYDPEARKRKHLENYDPAVAKEAYNPVARKRKHLENYNPAVAKEAYNPAKRRKTHLKNYNSAKRRKKHSKNYNPKKRQEKHLKEKDDNKKSSTPESRLKSFRNECKFGPIFTCICCKRQLFKRGVRPLLKRRDLESHLKGSGMFKKYLASYASYEDESLKKAKKWSKFGRLDQSLKVNGKFYLCHSCIRYLEKLEMPPLCSKNNLDYMKTPECLEITNLEKQLIAKSLVFIKVRQLPKTRMDAMNDRVINVAIEDDDIIKHVKSLPRTEKNSGMVTVGMKRKMDLKNYHKLGMIRPEKIYKALSYLKDNHPDYKDIAVVEIDDWLQQYHSENGSGDESDMEDTNETSEIEDQQASEEAKQDEPENTINQPGENIFNAVTCLIPDDPLSDLIGKLSFF